MEVVVQDLEPVQPLDVARLRLVVLALVNKHHPMEAFTDVWTFAVDNDLGYFAASKIFAESS